MVKITEGVSNAKNNEGIATEKRQSCTGSRNGNGNDNVFRDEMRVIAPHMRNQKTTSLILCRFVFSPLRIHKV